MRFPGQYFDEETGLHYNHFRDYDPRVGRYVQSDPIALEDGLNTFLYTDANPIQKMDPTGENATWGIRGAWWFGNRVIGRGSSAALDWALTSAFGVSLGVLIYDTCHQEEEECRQEIEDCIEHCLRARRDFNQQRGVWAGSWWRCMTRCVRFRCLDYLDEDLHGEP